MPGTIPFGTWPPDIPGMVPMPCASIPGPTGRAPTCGAPVTCSVSTAVASDSTVSTTPGAPTATPGGGTFPSTTTPAAFVAPTATAFGFMMS